MKNAHIVIIFLFAGLLFSAEAPVKSSGDLEFYLDTASFRSSLGNVYQEFYYQISLDQLTFEQIESNQVDSLLVSMQISSAEGELIYDDSWTTPVVAAATEQLGGRLIADQIDLLCDPGKYQASLNIREKSTNRSGTATLDFEAPDFTGTKLQLSSVEFVSEVSRDSSDSRLTKNGLFLLPNASRIYGGTLPMVIFYFEVYNAIPLDLPGNEYTIQYALLTLTGDTVRTLPPKTKSHQGVTSVEVNAISTAGLNQSQYLLDISVTDNNSGDRAGKQVKFTNYIAPVQIQRIELTPVAQIIQRFNEEELGLHMRQAKIVLSKEEFDLLQQLDFDGRKKALIAFWNRLDPDPATPENEYWDNFMDRVQLANARYTSGFSEGWNTDMGRILIKYGVPDDIERHPHSVDSEPYEVWHYYKEKGYKFIFIDEEGFNYYRLIYSNHEDVPSDPRYYDIIKNYQ